MSLPPPLTVQLTPALARAARQGGIRTRPALVRRARKSENVGVAQEYIDSFDCGLQESYVALMGRLSVFSGHLGFHSSWPFGYVMTLVIPLKVFCLMAAHSVALTRQCAGSCKIRARSRAVAAYFMTLGACESMQLYDVTMSGHDGADRWCRDTLYQVTHQRVSRSG